MHNGSGDPSDGPFRAQASPSVCLPGRIAAEPRRRDANHCIAVRLWTPGLPILTTNHVVGETWTFLRRRDGHPSAVAFLDAVESAAWLTVVHVEDAIERDARAWLRRHDERDYSCVDATSFAVMRRARLREALAFDGDFSAAGFVEVRPAT